MFSARSVYNRSGFFNHVDEWVADAVVDYLAKSALPHTEVRFSQQGGAANKVASKSTASPHRDTLFQCTVDVDWTDPKDAIPYRKYANDSWAVIGPMSMGGFYINQAIDPSEADVRRTFGENYERLVEVKTKYDPTNFFHLNPNIRPRAQGGRASDPRRHQAPADLDGPARSSL